VHDTIRPRHLCSVGRSYGLMTETDPQDGYPGTKMTDSLHRNTGIFRGAWAGRNKQCGRVQSLHAADTYLVIPEYLHLSSHGFNHLDQVEGKGIVVVDYQDHFSFAISMALNMPAAFFRVSSYSFSGKESYTMPAPAWMESLPPEMLIVRMVMQKSMSPLNPK